MNVLSSYALAVCRAVLPVPAEERAREGPHAQFGEDRIMERIFAGAEHGYCAEVGAYDGTTGSTTYLFERKGWDCLLVEPIPWLAEKARECRSLVVNCAASAHDGEATLYVGEQVEQMSSLGLTPAQRERIGYAGGAVKEITVPTTTLDTLLEEAGFPRLDFVTIDVEGHELDVLRGFTLERHRPRVVILEQNADGTELSHHMAQHGYVHFRRTGVNEWYARRDDPELARPEALVQFHRDEALRRPMDRLKAWIAARLPASLRRRLPA